MAMYGGVLVNVQEYSNDPEIFGEDLEIRICPKRTEYICKAVWGRVTLFESVSGSVEGGSRFAPIQTVEHTSL